MFGGLEGQVATTSTRGRGILPCGVSCVGITLAAAPVMAGDLLTGADLDDDGPSGF